MGWIKLWRDLLDKPIWTKSTPAQCKILVTLLLMVNYRDNEWEWKGRKFMIKPGQIITSIKSIREAVGEKTVSTQNIRTALVRFKNLKFLTQEATKAGRLITIINWDTYQGEDDDPNIDANKGLTKDQQRPNKGLTPIKEDKKDKKVRINSKIAAADYLRSLKIEEAKIVSIFQTRKVEVIINAIELTVERKPDSPSGYFLSIVEKDDLPPSKVGKERLKKAAEASRVAAQETKYLKARTRELEEDRAAQAELEELEAAHASMGDEDLAGVEKVIDLILASMPGALKPKRENLRLGAVKKFLESKEKL